jgi:hypothetical protein
MVSLLRVVAVLVVTGGILCAYRTMDGHWVEKSGKLVVALSFLLTYVQFTFELRHDADRPAVSADELEKRGVAPFEQHEIAARVRDARRVQFDGTRSYILKNALVVAAAGEFLSAFGGDLFHMAMPHV